MEQRGWIKLHRREHEWLGVLTDAQARYYLEARMAAKWDRRHKEFGTFECRTLEVKRHMLPGWSTGKNNTVKNELLGMGYFQKTMDQRRLRVTNAEIWLTRGKQYEDIIQRSDKNLQCVEYDVRDTEYRARAIESMCNDLALRKRLT